MVCFFAELNEVLTCELAEDGYSAYGGPAMVQLWDIEDSQGCASFPANDAYITSLKIHPMCDTVITGAGDGTVGLFDIMTCGGICRLSVGSNFEVTSVSFRNCGTYFHASSTTLVWDTRMMSMTPGPMRTERPLPVSEPALHSARPLHCLSHGKQMPTAEHAGQLPGFVDEGDQGVNDARWLHNMPVLVTASGNGSIAMWNVTLRQPCVRHLSSHTRCANTVAVAPNVEYICSREAANRVVRGGGGRIINLSSSLVGLPTPGFGAYTASKAAVEMMTRILAQELRGTHITANCVAPGPVATDMFFTGRSAAAVEAAAKSSPFDRLGKVEDVAPVVAFLASDEGEWVNAQVVRVNGGRV